MKSSSYFPKLSKSKFMAGIQCLKYLYMKCYSPELAPPVDPVTQSIFDQGHKVGVLAQQAFPGGILIDEDHRHQNEAVQRTQDLIHNQDIQAIYEAAFEHERIIVRVDILERVSRHDWRIIEVKSTTKAKDEHVYDVGIQNYVLSGSGINISNACLMHLNNQYVYDGNEYNLGELFTIEDLTSGVYTIEGNISQHLEDQWECLKLEEPPDIPPGPYCLSPFPCPFFKLCNEEKPVDWVGYLPGVGSKKIESFKSRGIESIYDFSPGQPLNEVQKRVCDCIKLNQPYYDENLQTDISELQYPLCYMDFETFNPAIPLYAGTKPYEQIPFQWSIHVQDSPGSTPEHFEFLAENKDDPRKEFLVSLLTILERSAGHVVVYNQSFESTCLNNLARCFPVYSSRISSIQQRLWDLLKVVKQNVYHPDFQGSFSIKKVLPALIPEMSYEGMEVADGKMAGMAFEKINSDDIPPEEKKRLRQALLDYCEQDTFAMVKLMDHLRNLSV